MMLHPIVLRIHLYFCLRELFNKMVGWHHQLMGMSLISSELVIDRRLMQLVVHWVTDDMTELPRSDLYNHHFVWNPNQAHFAKVIESH